MRLHLTLGNSLSALRLGVSHGAGCVLGAAPGGHRLTALPRCGMTADMRRAGSTSALREIRVAALFPTAVRRVFVVMFHEVENAPSPPRAARCGYLLVIVRFWAHLNHR